MLKKVFAIALLSSFYLGFSQSTEELLRNYLRSNQALDQVFRGDFYVENEDLSQSLKGKVIKIQHTENGVPVFNSVGTALIREGKIVYFNADFSDAETTIGNPIASLSPEDAFQSLEIPFDLIATDYTLLAFHQPENLIQHFAKHRLVYFKDDQKLKLGYEFFFSGHKSSNFWDVIVDARTGEILHRQNMTLSCGPHEKIKKEGPFSIPTDDKVNSNILTVKNADNASYRVFPLPIESPNFGNRILVSNPWSLQASPEGWHSDATTSYTITRGNNVYAYDDSNAANSPGFSPNGGSTRVFDYPLNLTTTNAKDNLSASATNLFYALNMSHDLFYRLGFTESARNYQANNFGKGGAGNDFILAETQDGEDFDNSNFSITPDGTSGRLQMFLWNPAFVQHLFYNNPATAIPRTPLSRTAQFGPALTAAGITADVVVSNVLDACTNLTANSLQGKIGLAERGNCNFTVKVKNIQDAGAVGAIIYNAVNSPAISTMGGTDPTINIPSILIENSEGEFIKNTINGGEMVNATLKHDSSQDQYIDGSFDNGISIHEYAHGVTNRLTGNGYSCLNKNVSAEQMGEGWSDFFALMFTNTTTSSANNPRSIATFANGQDANGGGLRPAKYSPDFSVNGFTYGDTNGLEFEEDGVLVPDVHRIGFVWASILWDLHWKFAEKYGYEANLIDHPNSGSAKITQLVMDALKLQECNPTFISGRDAILAADIASSNGQNHCLIWETFAKRGVGIDASAGSKMSINDQTEDFALPYECQPGKTPLSEVTLYPNPANEEFNLLIPVANFGKAMIEIYDMSGKLVKAQEKLMVTTKQTISISGFENGVYIVAVQGKNWKQSFRLMVKK